MDDVKAQIDQLELFNEKVDEFRESSFATAIFAPDSGLSVTAVVGNMSTVERRGPTMDSIQAWAPSIRMLISKKDRISFKQMEILYANVMASNKCPENPSDLLRSVEKFLDSPLCVVTEMSIVPLQINRRDLTVRSFLEQFIYGDILHLDEDKRENYVNWRSQPFIFEFALNTFCVLGARILNFALALSQKNHGVITHLEKTRSTC